MTIAARHQIDNLYKTGKRNLLIQLEYIKGIQIFYVETSCSLS